MKHILQEYCSSCQHRAVQEGREVRLRERLQDLAKSYAGAEASSPHGKGCEACSNTGYKGGSACMSC